MFRSEGLALNMLCLLSIGKYFYWHYIYLIVIVIKLVAEVEYKTQQNDPEPVANEEDNPE